MGDLTSNLYLNLYARDLSAAGFRSVVSGVRDAVEGMLSASSAGNRALATQQKAALRAQQADQLAGVREGAYQRSAALRAAAARDAFTAGEDATAQIQALRRQGNEEIMAVRQAARGKNAAARAAAADMVAAIRVDVRDETQAVATAARQQVMAIRTGAAQQVEATRTGSIAQIASIKSVAREQEAADTRRAESHKRLASIIAGGVAVAGGVAIGAALIGADAVKQASAYQKMITVAGNNTTLTPGGVAQMSKTVKTLASETGAPPDQLTEGFRKIVNYGYLPTDAAKIEKVGTKTALSTGANVGDTNGTLANILHEYGKGPGDAAAYANIMHLAAAQGNTTLQGFVTTGARAIDMAANLGIPFTQAAATLSALSRHEKLADANTQVVGMLSKIVNPSKSSQKELAKLTLSSGIDVLGDFTPAGLKRRGITGAMADLKAATGGDIQKMFQAIPALRGGVAAMLLTGTAGGDYKSIKGSLDKTAAGKTNPVDTAYAAYMKTLDSSVKIVKANIQLLEIEIGTRLLPAVTRGAQALGNVLGGALRFVQNPSARVKQLLHDVGLVAGSMAGTLGTAAHLFGQVGGAVGRLLSPLTQTTAHLKLGDGALRTIGKTLGGVTLAIGLFATGLKIASLWEGITKTATVVWTGAQKLLNLALKDNPIGLVVLALGGLVLGLTYAYDHSKTFRDMVNGVWAFLQRSFGPILTSIAGTLKAVLAQAVDYVSGHAKSWWDMLRNVWSFLQSTFGPILKTVAGILTTVLVVEIQATIDVVKALWSWGGTLVNFWKGSFQPAIGTLAGAFSSVLKKAVTDITTTVQGLWQKAHDLWDMLANVLKPAIQPVADVFTNVFGKALSGIADKIGGLISSFGSLLKMLGQKVSTYGLDQIKATVDSIKAGDTGKGGSGAWGDGTGTDAGAAHKTAMTVPFIGPTRGLIAARFGAAYNHDAASTHSQQVLGFHAAHHGLTTAQRRNAENIVNPGPKARNPVQNAQIGYSTDMTRWKLGQRSDGQIERDIAALAKLDPKKAALLQAQFDNAVHHRNDAIRHAAAAQQQRSHHRNVAIAHAGAVKAHHDKMVAAHQQTVDLGALYYRDNMTLQQDMRDRNFTAARQVIAAMTSIKQAMEIQHGISKGQAAQDARAFSNDQLSRVHKAASAPARADLSTLSGLVKHWRDMFMADKKAGNTNGELADLAKFKTADLAYQKALRPKNGALAVTLANDDWNKLGGALSNGLKKLTAKNIGTGFHKSVYGYTSRQQVGQGVGLGETLVTFGGRVGKDPAQQMIEKLETQVQQLTQQNQALTALLGAVEDGTAATVRVGDLLARPPRSTPGAGIGNPLRVQGLATAVR